MSTWTVVLLAGLATLAIRLVPVAVLSTRPVPAWLERVGPLTAPVAFAALGASSVTGAAAGGPAELVPLLAATYPLDLLGGRQRHGDAVGRRRAGRLRGLTAGP
jgi:branched-subunit amino acid transport protein